MKIIVIWEEISDGGGRFTTVMEYDSKEEAIKELKEYNWRRYRIYKAEEINLEELDKDG